jgi:hypothetical protein
MEGGRERGERREERETVERVSLAGAKCTFSARPTNPSVCVGFRV